MRHKKKGKKLARKKPHRDHLMRNLITQILLHSKIKTTLPKAKAVKPQLEKIISKALNKDEMNARRFLNSYLYSKDAVSNLLGSYRNDLKNINGGYSKLIKLGKRKGDGSPMVLIDLKISDDNRPSKEIVQDKEEDESKQAEKPEEEKDSFWDRFKPGQKKPSEKPDKTGEKTQPKTKKDPTQRTTSK